jgi:pyrimidine deaminase RibD-like protein
MVLGLQEPHPHVVCVVIDDEHAVAEAMWGWDIDMTPNV